MIRIALVLALFACSSKGEPEQTREPAQMRAMLLDRPKLAHALESHADVERWLADRFASVDWDPSAPQSGQPAEHVGPTTPGGHFTLRVATRRSGLDQLGEAIFELFNMEGDAQFDALFARARAKSLSRDAFAEAMTRQEHVAMIHFKHFALEHALVPEREDTMLKRMLDTPDEFGAFVDWIKHLDGSGYDPVVHWRDVYDQL